MNKEDYALKAQYFLKLDCKTGGPKGHWFLSNKRF